MDQQENTQPATAPQALPDMPPEATTGLPAEETEAPNPLDVYHAFCGIGSAALHTGSGRQVPERHPQTELRRRLPAIRSGMAGNSYPAF